MNRALFLFLVLVGIAQSRPSQAAYTAVAAGRSHTCAIGDGGTVSCWGYNDYGQLGLGDRSDRDIPTLVPGLSDVKALVTGGNHTCVILQQDGTVRCWGSNSSGQLGLGTTDSRRTPTPVPGLTGVVALAAGDRHTCAAKTDGSDLCWERNDRGQLGLGTVSDGRMSPMLVSGLSSVVQLTAGAEHACASKADGSVVCWGSNSYGQLGPDGEGNQPTPTSVPSVGVVTAVDAGSYHTCALKPDNTVLCWGHNYNSQLGIGTLGYARRPRQLDHILENGFDQPQIP